MVSIDTDLALLVDEGAKGRDGAFVVGEGSNGTD